MLFRASRLHHTAICPSFLEKMFCLPHTTFLCERIFFLDKTTRFLKRAHNLSLHASYAKMPLKKEAAHGCVDSPATEARHGQAISRQSFWGQQPTTHSAHPAAFAMTCLAKHEGAQREKTTHRRLTRLLPYMRIHPKMPNGFWAGAENHRPLSVRECLNAGRSNHELPIPNSPCAGAGLIAQHHRTWRSCIWRTPKAVRARCSGTTSKRKRRASAYAQRRAGWFYLVPDLCSDLVAALRTRPQVPAENMAGMKPTP